MSGNAKGPAFVLAQRLCGKNEMLPGEKKKNYEMWLSQKGTVVSAVVVVLREKNKITDVFFDGKNTGTQNACISREATEWMGK